MRTAFEDAALYPSSRPFATTLFGAERLRHLEKSAFKMDIGNGTIRQLTGRNTVVQEAVNEQLPSYEYLGFGS